MLNNNRDDRLRSQGERPQALNLKDDDALRRVILEMSIETPELPAERRLAEDLGVPRSRLRRVLADLREQGRLPPAQVGRRAFRRDTSRVDALARVANPTDVIELRVMLEPNFARLAACRASALEIARITRAATSSPDDDYGAADLAFHREIARASRNPLAAEFYQILRQVGTDARVRLPERKPRCSKRLESRDREHAAIAKAISERDPEQAEKAMRVHLANVQQEIGRYESPSIEPVAVPLASAAGGRT